MDDIQAAIRRAQVTSDKARQHDGLSCRTVGPWRVMA